jgi:hypothetical protein
VSATVKSHIRSNVVGYIALFCFVVGGTAIASSEKGHRAKRNSVVSSSIANGAVKKKDLGDNSVDGSKVADGSLTSADFAGDLGGDGGGDIPDGSITGDDIDPTTTFRFERAIPGGGQSVQIDATGLRGDTNSGHFGAGYTLDTEGFELSAGPAIGYAKYGPGKITLGQYDESPLPAQSNEVALVARDEGDGMELVAVFGDGTEVVLASDAP